jgi:hypothetical protein
MYAASADFNAPREFAESMILTTNSLPSLSVSMVMPSSSCPCSFSFAESN